MSDAGPKTDKSDSAKAATPNEHEDPDLVGDLISEDDLEKEILEASPHLQTLVGDLQKSEFSVSIEGEKTNDLHPTTFPGKLKAHFGKLKRALSVFLLILGNRLKRIKALISDAGHWFQKLSKAKKVGFIFWLFAVVLVGVYATQLYKGHVLQESKGPYHFSMDDYAESNNVLEENEKREPLYDSIRIAPNILLLPKIVVNIKPSSLSKSNPMAAFEFYIDSIAPEAVIEVKEHEAAVLDKVERRIEEFDFDELQTVEGKKRLCTEITSTINSVITQGSIRRTLIKTVFLKP